MIAWLFTTRAGLAVSGLVIICLILAGANLRTSYWKHRAEKAESKVSKMEARVKLKDIEVHYAPKITAMAEISKRRQPKAIKPKIIEQQAPKAQKLAIPAPDPAEWADAVRVAEFINAHWGLRGRNGALSGQAADARVQAQAGRPSG